MSENNLVSQLLTELKYVQNRFNKNTIYKCAYKFCSTTDTWIEHDRHRISYKAKHDVHQIACLYL